MVPIANNEAGSSVRAKLNKIMRLVTEAVVVKTVDETRANAAGLFNDLDLLVTVEAGVSYLVKFSLVFTQSGVNDNPTITWTIPAHSGNVQWLTEQIRDGASPAVQFSAGAIIPATAIATASGTYEVRGWMRISPTADGTIVLQWGCGGSGSAKLREGSWIQMMETTFAAS